MTGAMMKGMIVCVCVRACVRACMCVCVYVHVCLHLFVSATCQGTTAVVRGPAVSLHPVDDTPDTHTHVDILDHQLVGTIKRGKV